MDWSNDRLKCEDSFELGVGDSETLRLLVEEPPNDLKFPGGIGGEWRCPACGSNCSEETPGLVQCDHCGRSLAKIASLVVERFKHDPMDEL